MKNGYTHEKLTVLSVGLSWECGLHKPLNPVVVTFTSAATHRLRTTAVSLSHLPLHSVSETNECQFQSLHLSVLMIGFTSHFKV